MPGGCVASFPRKWHISSSRCQSSLNAPSLVASDRDGKEHAGSGRGSMVGLREFNKRISEQAR